MKVEQEVGAGCGGTGWPGWLVEDLMRICTISLWPGEEDSDSGGGSSSSSVIATCAQVSHLYVPTRWQSSDGYSIPWAVAGESDQTPRTNPEQSRLSSNIREAERSVTSKLHFSRTLPQPPQQSTIYLLCCRWKLNSFNSNKSVDNISTSTQRSVCWHCC